MVRVIYDKKFEKALSRIKDNTTKNSVKNKIRKIIENPEIGKPMMYQRKGTRELYAGSFRLSRALNNLYFSTDLITRKLLILSLSLYLSEDITNNSTLLFLLAI